jgi:hypothetical protein
MTKAKLPSTPTGRKRLLTLAKLLEKDAKNKKGLKFDMGTWGVVDTDDDGKLLGKPGLNCHTTACAMGLAALSGKFARQGLRYEVDYGDINMWMKGSELYQGDGIVAAKRLFSIDNDAAMWLFGGSTSCDDAHRLKGREAELKVAKRIRNYVAGKETVSDNVSI